MTGVKKMTRDRSREPAGQLLRNSSITGSATSGLTVGRSVSASPVAARRSRSCPTQHGRYAHAHLGGVVEKLCVRRPFRESGQVHLRVGPGEQVQVEAVPALRVAAVGRGHEVLGPAPTTARSCRLIHSPMPASRSRADGSNSPRAVGPTLRSRLPPLETPSISIRTSRSGLLKSRLSRS